ncbi:MAG: 50S ribosomal protein L25 [Anaerolineae bacterium]|nr:50S ribosomal protein L25 [Anaerolineae bacterium]MBL6965543.1 50S ribosomal protein L25 [Anaerolineales bacterium]
MSEQIILEATRREVIGKQVKQLRREGKLPAVVYGYGVDATPILLDLRETSRILKNTSVSTLINLKVDDAEHNVLVREVQKGILSRAITHIDFQAIAMNVLVRTQVPLVVLSENVPAVNDFDAMLNIGVDSVEIECLPRNLPDQIEVDASTLISIGDSITVADLVLPEGVAVMDDPETMLVFASSQQILEEPEEEVDEFGDELAEGEPEVLEQGKGDEEAEE